MARQTHKTCSDLDMMMLREGFIKFGPEPAASGARRSPSISQKTAKTLFWRR